MEEQIAKILEAENAEYKALSAEHKSLKTKLSEFNDKVYLTPEEEFEKKKLQKLKLAKKDRMAQMIRDYKAPAN